MPDSAWYRQRIYEMLKIADERELCLIYAFLKALNGKK